MHCWVDPRKAWDFKKDLLQLQGEEEVLHEDDIWKERNDELIGQKWLHCWVDPRKAWDFKKDLLQPQEEQMIYISVVVGRATLLVYIKI